MRVVFAVVARDDNGSTPAERRRAVTEALRVAERAIGQAIPVREPELSRTSWVSEQGFAAACSWSNEVGRRTRRSVASEPARWLGLVGYTARDLDLSAVADTDDLLTASTALPGCFGLVRVTEGRVEVVTDATRSNNLFITETNRVRLVASRAFLAKFVAAATVQGSDRPVLQPDFVGGRHMAVAGYYLGDRTPFRGVRAVPPSSCATLSGSASTSRSAVLDYEPAGSHADRQRVLADTAGALIDTFSAITPGALELSLSGGRDSRLLAAALSNVSDFEVVTGTVGTDEDPDVVIARRVAASLGFDHVVIPPYGSQGDDLWAEEPLSRIVRVLDVYDGMTSAWDGIRDYRSFVPVASMSGAGGEILRGSVVWREHLPLTPELVSPRLRNLFLGGVFIHPDTRQEAEPDGAELLELVERDPYRAADDFYLVHRAGRWASARRSSERAWQDVVDPFLDNVFVRSVLRIHPEVRWPERFTFDLINVLAPDLRDLPIEGRRWSFERDAPMDGAPADEVMSWDRRHAMTRSREVDKRLWYKLGDPAVHSRLTTLILETLEGPAGKIFDHSALERYLAPGASGSEANIIWNIATAAISVSMPWYATTRPPIVTDIPVRSG